MSEAIIVALITAGASLIGIFWNAHKSEKTRKAEQSAFAQELYAKLERQSELADAKLEAKLENYRALTDAKIDELTREVREHNNFARRMPVLEEKAKRTDRRLDELEKNHG